MKAKKILSLALCLMLSVAFIGCKDKHTHEYEWSVTEPATCVSDGKAQGVCSCGDVTEKVIEAGEAYHDYEWQIVSKPTGSTEGKAKGVCSYVSSHKTEKVLPKLTPDSEEYTVDDTDGIKKHYTLKDDEDISFDTYAVFDIASAVDAAVDTLNAVYDGSVQIDTSMVVELDDNNAATIKADDELTRIFGDKNANVLYGYANASSKVEFEFGDRYYHYSDESMDIERWYQVMDPETETKWYGIYPNTPIFAIERREDRNFERSDMVYAGASEKDFDGYAFGFTHAMSGIEKRYGAGAFLRYLYDSARNNANKDAKFTSETDGDGKVTYKFGYGIKPSGNNRQFHMINAEFTLDGNYVVDYLKAEARSYVTTTYVGHENKDIGIFRDDLKDDDGITYTRLTEGKEKYYKYMETFEIRQNSYRADGAATPVNPHKFEDMLVSDYKLMEVEVDDAREVTKDIGYVADDLGSRKAATELTMQMRDISANGKYNSYFDPVRFYERTPDGDLPLSFHYSDGADGHIKANFEPTNSCRLATFNFFAAGNHTLVLKTAETEKILSVYVPWEDPESFEPDVYVYDEEKDEGIWNATVDTFTVYAGEALYFTSRVGHPAYEQAGFTASYVNSQGETVQITDKAVKEGKSVSVFRETVPGEYTVTLTNVGEGATGKTCEMTVIVTEAPALADYFYGEFENAEKGITVTFVPASGTPLAGTLTVSIKTAGAQGSAPIVALTTFDYTVNQAGEVTLTNASGANADYDFTFELTEKYNLFMSYTNTKFNISVRVMLREAGAVRNNITGTYIFKNMSAAQELTVNVAGKYKLTASLGGNIGYFYSINGVITNAAVSQELDLKSGDVLKVWCNNARDGDFFTLELVSKTLVGNATMLDTATVAVGESVSIVSGATESDLAGVEWQSMKPSIVTVDSNGVVTGVKKGTAIIVATVNGYKVSCIVTVK